MENKISLCPFVDIGKKNTNDYETQRTKLFWEDKFESWQIEVTITY